jgi:hypothetical protein
MQWESISDSTAGCMSARLKVPGGWIVRTVFLREVYFSTTGAVGTEMKMIFVSDPDHKWN